VRYALILSLLFLLASLIYQPTKECTTSRYYDIETIDVIALGPPNYQVYDYTVLYAEKEGVPLDYALNCAYEETLYKGFDHFTYKPFVDKWRVSYADAYGPYQVQIPTANWITKEEYTAEDLGYNIKINVRTSMKYIAYLYSQYEDWSLTFAAYNRGPTRVVDASDINTYAQNVVKQRRI